MHVRANKARSATLAGWLAAELVRWQSLHEDLHATTQVLAELAGLEAACCHASACLVGRLVATLERARGSEALASAGLALAS